MGRPKALLPWPLTQVPFAVHVTGTLRDAGIGPLGVVTGEHHDAIAATLAASGVKVLYNARHPEGQLGSLLHGLRWAFAQTAGEWVLATLVDVPGVQSSTVRELVQQAYSAGDVRAIRPVHGARHGHPVVWRRDVLALLESADPSHGARAVMRSLAAEGAVCDLQVDDAGVISDLDTPEDYDALMRASRG